MRTDTTPLTLVRDVAHGLKEAASELIENFEEAITTPSPTPTPTSDASSTAAQPVEDSAVEDSAVEDSAVEDSGPETTEALTWHLTPMGDMWALKIEGLDQPSLRFATKQEALDAGRETARAAAGRLIVHRANGTIQRHLDYAA